jgi:hypothetical protein
MKRSGFSMSTERRHCVQIDEGIKRNWNKNPRLRVEETIRKLISKRKMLLATSPSSSSLLANLMPVQESALSFENPCNISFTIL